MIIIITGVSGSGKTTIGKILSKKIGAYFFDADDFHPLPNINKMTKGIPLSDLDRKPWLDLLSKKIIDWEKKYKISILACSALKESYRVLLNVNSNNIKWIFLTGSFTLIRDRLKKRNKHFMSNDLLKSQFEILEEPKEALKIEVSLSPNYIVKKIMNYIK